MSTEQTVESFTQQELDILVEALDAWVNKEQSGEMVGDLLEAIAIPKEKQDEKYLQNKASRKHDGEVKKSMRKQQAILLQAKIINLSKR